MSRVFLVVMDSVGIGGAKDADRFFNQDRPDSGANTIAHIAQACAEGLANEGRDGPMRLPTLEGLGLGAAVRASSEDVLPGFEAQVTGFWAVAHEASMGKDTPSGHWELAGLPVPWDWHYFPDARPAFDKPLVDQITKIGGVDGDTRQLPRLRHTDHPRTRCLAHANGLSDLLHLGRQRVSSRRP